MSAKIKPNQINKLNLVPEIIDPKRGKKTSMKELNLQGKSLKKAIIQVIADNKSISTFAESARDAIIFNLNEVLTSDDYFPNANYLNENKLKEKLTVLIKGLQSFFDRAFVKKNVTRKINIDSEVLDKKKSIDIDKLLKEKFEAALFGDDFFSNIENINNASELESRKSNVSGFDFFPKCNMFEKGSRQFPEISKIWDDATFSSNYLLLKELEEILTFYFYARSKSDIFVQMKTELKVILLFEKYYIQLENTQEVALEKVRLELEKSNIFRTVYAIKSILQRYRKQKLRSGIK